MASRKYPNRSDLRNPAEKIAKQAATGQTYGAAAEQMRAQQAVPMGGPPTTAAAPQQPTTPRPTPGSLGALDRPSERTDQTLVPMQNQTPMMFNPSDPVVEKLSMLYAQYPNDDLAALLSAIKYGGL